MSLNYKTLGITVSYIYLSEDVFFMLRNIVKRLTKNNSPEKNVLYCFLY